MNAPLNNVPVTLNHLFKFILPSLLGCLLFLVPLSIGGKTSIGLSFIMDLIRLPFKGLELELIVSMVTLSALGALVFSVCSPKQRNPNSLWYGMFYVTTPWLLLRVLSAVLGVSVYFGIAPAVLLAEDTAPLLIPLIGSAVLFNLLLAYFLMPLLTDFGLLEFVGTIIRKPFEWLFTLPGRAAIDATSSIVSSASVGVVLTINQYEAGRYTGREAASVVTNFSIVSLPFCLVIAETAGLDHLFFSWYLTVLAACFICAGIMVRLPPLVNITEAYFEPIGKRTHEDEQVHRSIWRWALRQALLQANTADTLPVLVTKAWRGSLSTIFNVLGPSTLIAVGSAVLAFHTPVFDYLALPIRWLLDGLSLPEAGKVAPGFLIGFLDQFTPAVIATQVESERMRFVLAGLSVSQLIFMADVGVLVLRSSLPLRFRDLAIIFAMRTAIVFPIFLMAGAFLL